jgi:hypothetical protein
MRITDVRPTAIRGYARLRCVTLRENGPGSGLALDPEVMARYRPD